MFWIERGNELHGTEISAAKPPLSSICGGKGCDRGDGWERVGCEDKLCDVGSVFECDGLGRVVVHDYAYFTTVVIVDDAATNVEMFEGEATAWFDGACDGGGNCKGNACRDFCGAVGWKRHFVDAFDVISNRADCGSSWWSCFGMNELDLNFGVVGHKVRFGRGIRM